MKKLLAALSTVGILVLGSPLYADQGISIEYLNSGKVLPKDLPFSEAVRVGGTLYLSGHIGNLPGTPKLAPGGIKEEARQTMENIKTSLEAHGYSMANLVKCTHSSQVKQNRALSSPPLAVADLPPEGVFYGCV